MAKTTKKSAVQKYAETNPYKVIALALGIILIVQTAVVFATVLNPGMYTDATAGYAISKPFGWTRTDNDEGILNYHIGEFDNPDALISVSGQRNAAPGFYDQGPEAVDLYWQGLLDSLAQDGQDPIVGQITGIEAENIMVERHTQAAMDDAQGLKITFTANDEGEEMKGEHYFLIAKNGGIYNLVVMADVENYDSNLGDIEASVRSFTAN